MTARIQNLNISICVLLQKALLVFFLTSQPSTRDALYVLLIGDWSLCFFCTFDCCIFCCFVYYLATYF